MSRTIQHSHSSTGTFITCPKQYEQIKWLKAYKSESNPAAERGSKMHEEYEHCILDDTDYSIDQYQWILDDFRAQTGLKIPEMVLAINKDWEPVPNDLGVDDEGKTINNPDVWFRGIVDFTCLNGSHAFVSDLKTGKRKMKDCPGFETWLLDRHTDGMHYAPKILANARQASEYALLIFHHFESIETMDFRFIWSDVEGITEDLFQFERHRDSKNLHKTMLATPKLIQQAVDTDTWIPNPSGLCANYCPVIDCEYYGKRFSEIKKMQRKMK